MNTISGTTMSRNAAAASRLHSVAYGAEQPGDLPRSSAGAAALDVDQGHQQVVPDPQELEDARSAAIAGTDSGTTIVRKIATFEAPSIRAASIRSFGRVMKKFRSRKIPNGSAKAVCASQTAPYVVSQPGLTRGTPPPAG